MERSHEPLQRALATLRTRWGSAAIRLGDGRPVGSVAAAGEGAPAVHGSLALAALPGSHPGGPLASTLPPETRAPEADAPEAHVISTGFPALDAILGPSGLPAQASVVVRGGPSSGKTTLALRCAAEAQASGDIVAWLDLTRAFDPVEAGGRGIDLRWLLVIRPSDPSEGMALAGALLAGRSVGLLVVDLPARAGARLDDQLRRLTAHARRVGARLILLQPRSGTGAPGSSAVGRSTSLRLELERQAWLRLGRDVVGQRTAVDVAKNRYGPPGRRVELDIHYLAEGERAVAAGRWATDAVDGETAPAPAVRSARTVPGRPEPGPRLVVV